MLNVNSTSKIGQKLNISNAQLDKSNRFNIEWQLQKLIDRLFETEQPFDFILASVLVDVMSVLYQIKKVKWWIQDRSSVSWVWWQCNKLGEKLKLRKSIRYEYEFSHWGPNALFDDMDFDDII